MEMRHYLLTYRIRRDGRGTRKVNKTFLAQDDTHARRRIDDELSRHAHVITKSIKLFVLFTIQA